MHAHIFGDIHRCINGLDTSACEDRAVGGTGGHAWDEGGHGASAGGYTGVRRMSIGSSWCVSSMLFEYDDNGKRVKGTPQGERDNGIPEEELDFHGEVLTHMCGYHDNHLIRWLQFRSNRNRTFGPYGNLGEDRAGWTRFEVSMEHSGSIVGFCGRSGNFTDAIGVYVAVWNPERFYDSMRRQGVRVYRASPLRMDLRQIEEEKKKEEVERGRLQKEIKEGRESLRKLRLKLGVHEKLGGGHGNGDSPHSTFEDSKIGTTVGDALKGRGRKRKNGKQN
uniref:Jacalin-type lectin domain-containing protein n=1 Tax=Oryza rufipogon TaxID=4529 RepID=A0A0E0P5S9_ORYRU